MAEPVIPRLHFIWLDAISGQMFLYEVLFS